MMTVICSERVTQMTRTYNDIEAVNRLLEEKERDLELAAKIGQTLLQKNQDLTEKNEFLEEQLSQATEKTAQLSAETSDYEEKEAKLVTDCLDQLEFYRDELMKKTEENCSQKEEITGLLAQIVDLQKRSKTLTLENLDLQKTLEASQDSQRALTKEIAELKDKYDELCELLEENQEEIRQLRRKHKPQAVKHNYLTSSLLSIPSDSLASELESSYRSDVEYPPGYSPSERKAHSWKIFETVKAAKKAAASSQPPSRRSYSSNASLCSSNLFVPGYSPSSCNISLNHSGESTKNTSNRSSVYLSDGESEVSEGYHGDLDSLYGSSSNLGRPGIPGSNDLEAALRRLSMRRANELNEQDYFAEQERKKRERSDTDSTTTTGACRTPDSTLSTGSGLSAFSQLTGSNPYYRLPEKLKIVKPIEGSLTLRHWQQLATPHLGGIFESRPGVQIKGERNLDLEGEVYNISDIEEDDDQEYMAPKRYQDSSTVNTYTNSLVKHPNESHR
ncbi:hypothetical protein KUTeg_001413 [Tegillarca granosa]|uniref:Trafficking kinesin-binding protein 1 n=1 Tax=Tegillarca granosa TaxID=220873 RepID=A0ABQ9FUK9_TEGGR|nr:hypothetical protein KUTeg_001413 [Tegillarca granosa]